MVLIVTIPCHCLSLTLHNFILVLFIFSIKTLSELKEEHNVSVGLLIPLFTTKSLLGTVLSLSYLFIVIIQKGQ